MTVINVNAGRNVKICNITGAFLSSDINEDVKMALGGRLEELVVKITPQIYRQHMIYKKGIISIYVTLKKSLYGCLRSAFLFHERLVADMRGKGFELNPYDPCVANKMIVGKQMIVFWNLYNLKVSHVDPKYVTKFM